MDDFEPLKIYEASREEIVEAMQDDNSNRKKRGAISVADLNSLTRLSGPEKTASQPV